VMMGACHSPKTPAPTASNEPESTVEATSQPVPEAADEQEIPPPPGQSDPYEVDGIVEEVGKIPDILENSSESTPNRCTRMPSQLADPDDWETTEGIVVGDVEDDVYYEDSPLMFVEEMPEFPGGMDALQAFLVREIQYPQVAKDNGITGTVLVEFIVEKDGSVTNAKVKVPLFPECDKEACRAVMSMPKWKPGKNMGKPVQCYYQVPITFRP